MKTYTISLAFTLGLLSIFACDGSGTGKNENILPLSLSGTQDSMETLTGLMDTSGSSGITAAATTTTSSAAATAGCIITASSTNVHPGDPITFTMTGIGADVENSGFITGFPDWVGDLPATRTLIAPDTTTRYVLSVFTVNGVRTRGNNCETTVNVTPAPAGNAPLATCDLDIDKDVAAYGEYVTVSWNAQNTTSSFITPNRPIGAVVGADLPTGTKTFRNYWGTTYTMRVWNTDGQWAECSANLKENIGDNAPPIASDSAFTVSSAATLNETMRVTDLENDALNFQINTAPTLGSVVITDAATGAFTYTPNSGAQGTDSFTFSASDSAATSNIGVVRIQITAASGTLDGTFGTGGITITPVGSKGDVINAVTGQPDGKIVAAGTVYYGGRYVFGVVRYNADGTLDSSFGTGGKVMTPVGYDRDEAFAVVIQTDGKIVVAGKSSTGLKEIFGLVRYNTDGSLDTSFGSNGKVLTTPAWGSGIITSLALQADGKIIAAGNSYQPANYTDFTVARYNTNGTLDTTFGTTGIVNTALHPAAQETANDVAIQSDGKIVAAGVTKNTAGRHTMGMVRYNTDGSLDTSFDTDGIVTLLFGATNESAKAIAIQTDGKIVLGGHTKGSDAGGFYMRCALARFNTDGSLDTSFDSDGKAETQLGADGEEIQALDLQSDGKIVAAAYLTQPGPGSDFALMRYNTDGSLDSSFDSDGIVVTSVSSSVDLLNDMFIQADGRIVAAGTTRAAFDYDFLLVRYNH